MPTQTLSIKYSKNEGLLFSPSELLEKYFWGIPTCTQSGGELPKNIIKENIQAAQVSVETWLSVLFCPQILTEKKDFIKREYEGVWGFIMATYPINAAYKLTGSINQSQQIQMPKEWLSVRNTSDGKTFSRNVYIVPGGNGGNIAQSNSFTGVSPNLGWFGSSTVPNYWELKYKTGFDDFSKVMDIVDYVGKYASIPIFAMLGEVLLGVGISSQSLSFDGLSQSVSTLKSNQGGLFGTRINMYLTDLLQNFARIDKQYRGIIFNVF